MTDIPFNELIQSDTKRKQDYELLRQIYVECANESAYVRQAKWVADEDNMIYLFERNIGIKYMAITTYYVNKYSQFNLKDMVQLTENNRVLAIGEIKHIEVARSSGQVLNHMSKLSPNHKLLSQFSLGKLPPDFGTKHKYFSFNDHEILYFVYSNTNKWKIGESTYRIKSPLTMMLAPHKMISKCPVCDSQNKPMIDSVIGGKPKIICCDCNTIIRGIFGDDYTTNSLDYAGLQTKPEINIILNYSQSR